MLFSLHIVSQYEIFLWYMDISIPTSIFVMHNTQKAPGMGIPSR